MLLGIAVLTILVLGALFYWLDPRIHTFADGLWLAFITGATVGYGDVVPTTGATRLLAVLTVLVGVAMMTVFTAHVVTFFVGGEDARMREALQRDIVVLRGEIEKLLDAEELRLTADVHQQMRELRTEIAALREELRTAKDAR